VNHLFQYFTLATQLPELPDGPPLDNVRGPVEAGGGYEIWQIALAILTLLLIAAAFTWLYLRSRNQPTAALDPHTAALAELDAAPQAADDERFALLCANAVRRFMESRFDLPATSRTSAEILARLPAEAEEKDQVRDFLEHCDGVKFARRTFDNSQRIELLDTAKRLIETLNRKEPPRPV
jgi:hypothetical protein